MYRSLIAVLLLTSVTLTLYAQHIKPDTEKSGITSPSFMPVKVTDSHIYLATNLSLKIAPGVIDQQQLYTDSYGGLTPGIKLTFAMP